MTRKEMKKEIMKVMTEEAFEKRYNELIDWNTATQTLRIMIEELTSTTNTIERMHEIYYAIG